MIELYNVVWHCVDKMSIKNPTALCMKLLRNKTVSVMPSLRKKPQSAPLIHINKEELTCVNARGVWMFKEGGGDLSSSSLLCKLLKTGSDGLSPKQLAVLISCFFPPSFKPGTMASAWGKTRSWPCLTSTLVRCSRRCTWSRWCLYCPSSTWCKKSSRSPKFSQTRSTLRT